MTKKVLNLLFVLGILCTYGMQAQTTVKGVVVDAASSLGLPGVSVVVKGTSKGVTTDFDGNYSIEVSDTESILQFSYVGFTTQEIAVNGNSTINVSLIEDVSKLDEVVVTALGIKRERKSLGYSVQEVKGETLTDTREPNVVNALSGKIAGVQIIKGSNGPAGSSKIVLRGNSSLTGDNQPLIVVDGVPMDNFTGASNNDFFNPSSDLGNGLGDLNSEDIESLSVLKGASAAALYGSRAGNGVILITTKTGKGKKGLGISYSSTTGFESIFMTPDLQNNFAQGSNGIYDPQSGTSWGPRMDGQSEIDYSGNSVVLKPYDNIGNFYNNGFSQTHAVSFQQQVGEGSSFYTSISNTSDKSNIPGAELERLNVLTRGVSKFGEDKKWTIDAKVQYANTIARNRPLAGSNIRNAYGTIAQLPRSIDIRDFSEGRDEFGNHIWYQEDASTVNPYWAEKFNLNEDSRDRFLLNGSLKYEFTDWLRAEVNAGADLYTTNGESKQYAGSPLSNNGRYSLSKNTFIERNYSTLIVASKDNLFGKFGGSVTLGGNLMSQNSSGLNSNSGELEVPDLFSLNNGQNSASVGQGFSEKKINSLYGLFQLNYDGYLFVDVTARNDWSSALSKANRSFFYPSVSGSLVISDMIRKTGGETPSWFDFGKVRASYATVGNDLDAYQLYNSFGIGSDANGNTTAGTNNTLLNPDIKSELIKSLEFGFETRMFNNRVALDFTWYKSNATNQILDLALDPFSGFNGRKINAGDVQNTGIELGINADIIRSDDFNWNMSVNFSNNKNTIEALDQDVVQFGLGGFDNLSVIGVVGGTYGEIRGTKYVRVEDSNSPHFGKIVLDGDGLFVSDTDKFKLGDQQADALLGITNTFSYKNFTLGFLIDARIGGEIFSGTNLVLQESGNAAVTVINGQREDIVVDGVVSDGNGGFTPNTVAVSPQQYWEAITGRTGNLGINEANIYDATNVRLRNVSLNYNFPTKTLKNLPIQNLKLGISANNVWMISSHLNGIDPESVYSTGTNATGFESLSSPSTRSVFLNLVVNF
ncbi:SusC/RagA family TonB-linked outer membrane protein [Gelidibacter salicanalis]|uniref:SusC/RagA family TonB-linked outer membrane protein n=1 Tax=Gelidibacter salicanalis TaxID=291193 RepID=A0A934KL69_9FLAO|nr:SusC/RagA family TonB-linked outer membrane protein [Gelidibacter salicanalis]MBJ7879799.1 SusC/RagA family TonB-linked outer membrane protein [Gelidibacter salicanalis]